MAAINPIAIYGKSGHGKVVADIAAACGYDEILWIDDDRTIEHALSYETFKSTHPETPVALGIGNNTARQSIYDKLICDGLTCKTLCHPSAQIAPSVCIGNGTVVMPLAVINADTVIETGCIINSAAVIEHDNILDAFVHVSPSAALAGGVTVGAKAHIGIGSCVIQGVSIGDNAIIAAGSSVTTDIPKNVMAAGSPAVIKKRLHV